MAPDEPIEQALFRGPGPGAYRLLARSPDFRDDWLPEATALCEGFGEKPAGVTFAEALFARPLGKNVVAVVRVRDVADGLAFHVLAVGRALHGSLTGNPFQFADQFPPPDPGATSLSSLSWTAGPPPRRTVEEVQAVLKRTEGPALLGGAQVLVDGGRLVFERARPDNDLLAALWTLLPDSTRGELWPATFAFGNALRFHVLVVPHAAGDAFRDYVREDQAAQYPEGRYELALQTAVEAGDQEELDALFARRSRSQTLRLGWMLLVMIVGLALLSRLLVPSNPNPGPLPSAPQSAQEKPASARAPP